MLSSREMLAQAWGEAKSVVDHWRKKPVPYDTSSLLATTLEAYRPMLEDNLFNSKPLLWALKDASTVRDDWSDVGN